MASPNIFNHFKATTDGPYSESRWHSCRSATVSPFDIPFSRELRSLATGCDPFGVIKALSELPSLSQPRSGSARTRQPGSS